MCARRDGRGGSGRGREREESNELDLTCLEAGESEEGGSDRCCERYEPCNQQPSARWSLVGAGQGKGGEAVPSGLSPVG